jgi:hypothetical protein
MNPDRGSSFVHATEAPRLDDVFYLDNPNIEGFGVDPSDGLPRPIVMTTPEQSAAPQYHPSTFVCMADKSKFVRHPTQGLGPKDSGLETIEYPPDDVEQASDGTYVTKSSKLRVYPVREQCSKYVRILIPWEDDKERRKCMRLCTAQMSPDGEYYSLNDQEVLACELRTPRDPKSEALLDEFDAKVIEATKPSVEEEEPFNVDEELKNG